jgi:uncharacterized membrane protein HdeD (DUF308 family)
MQQFKTWRWWTVALRGVAALVLGILSLFAPGITFVGLVVLFGVYAIIDGTLAFGLASRVPALRTSMIVRGLISVVASSRWCSRASPG